MKKIYSAALHPTTTEGEYAWAEGIEEEHGEEWDGNVWGYVENLTSDDGTDFEITEEIEQTVHDRMPGAVFIVANGRPIAMYWAE